MGVLIAPFKSLAICFLSQTRNGMPAMLRFALQVGSGHWSIGVTYVRSSLPTSNLQAHRA
jgi:hypothetical protein